MLWGFPKHICISLDIVSNGVVCNVAIVDYVYEKYEAKSPELVSGRT